MSRAKTATAGFRPGEAVANRGQCLPIPTPTFAAISLDTSAASPPDYWSSWAVWSASPSPCRRGSARTCCSPSRSRPVFVLVAALRLPHIAHAEPLAQIADRLQHGPALLVLDNFEQLTPDGVVVVQALLTRLPHCAAWSLQDITGPARGAYLRGGAFAGIGQSTTLPGSCAGYTPRFSDHAAQRPRRRDACEQLEGIPLAVELAAAWIGVLTPRRC